jgi:hypothetical protein
MEFCTQLKKISEFRGLDQVSCAGRKFWQVITLAQPIFFWRIPRAGPSVRGAREILHHDLFHGCPAVKPRLWSVDACKLQGLIADDEQRRGPRVDVHTLPPARCQLVMMTLTLVLLYREHDQHRTRR